VPTLSDLPGGIAAGQRAVSSKKCSQSHRVALTHRPIDEFPITHHVGGVAVLTRSGPELWWMTPPLGGEVLDTVLAKFTATWNAVASGRDNASVAEAEEAVDHATPSSRPRKFDRAT
jgi:hypothetical protein